jgi:acetyl-CoA acetyltransferase
MAVEAIRNAIEDAGLEPDQIDGLTSHAFDPLTEHEIANSFGWKNLRFFGKTAYGNSSATVALASIGVATGQCDYAVAFRSLTGRKGDGPKIDGVSGEEAFYVPFGMRAPVHWMAVIAQRYLHEYNADPRAFGWISVACRQHGANNPLAVNYGNPITIEDHQSSRMIASPMRLLDCTPNTEGAVAIVVTTPERAKDLRQTPAILKGFVQGTGSEVENNTNYNRKRMIIPEETLHMSKEMYEKTGTTPADMDFVQVYDHFTPLVLMALEAWDFCPLGEGQHFVEGAREITVGGAAPLNTAGGHLGEAYMQSMGHVAEAVRQLRGTSTNQVPNAERGLVVSGVGLPGSSILLSK